jgi:hypothetical protein
MEQVSVEKLIVAQCQVISSFIWNLKVIRRIQKTPPLVSNQNPINPAHTLPPYLLKTFFTINLPSTPSATKRFIS